MLLIRTRQDGLEHEHQIRVWFTVGRKFMLQSTVTRAVVVRKRTGTCAGVPEKPVHEILFPLWEINDG